MAKRKIEYNEGRVPARDPGVKLDVEEQVSRNTRNTDCDTDAMSVAENVFVVTSFTEQKTGASSNCMSIKYTEFDITSFADDEPTGARSDPARFNCTSQYAESYPTGLHARS